MALPALLLPHLGIFSVQGIFGQRAGEGKGKAVPYMSLCRIC